MKKRKGIFITFEGIEGCGKTTHTQKIVMYLKEKGNEVIYTQEPGGTRIGKLLRDILLNPEYSEIVPETELLLYIAERVQHIKEVIKPALAKGKIVVSDRFMDATVAYQRYGRQLDGKLVHRLNKLAVSDCKPDLTILLDIEPQIGLARAVKGEADRLEKEHLAFHKRVRQGYLKIAKGEPKRIKVVKVKESIEETQKIIKNYIDKLLG